MFLEKLTQFSNNLSENVSESNFQIIKVTDELVELITYIDFSDKDARKDMLEILQILEYVSQSEKRPCLALTDAKNSKSKAFNSIKRKLHEFNQNGPFYSGSDIFLSSKSIVTLCLLYLIDGVLDKKCHEKLQNVLCLVCFHSQTCSFVVWCLLAILRTSVSFHIYSNVFPTWIPRKSSNNKLFFCNYERIFDMLSKTVWKCSLLSTPIITTFRKMMQDVDTFPDLQTWEIEPTRQRICVFSQLGDLMESSKFSTEYFDKITKLADLLMEKCANRLHKDELAWHQNRFLYRKEVRQKWILYEDRLRGMRDIRSVWKESDLLYWLSRSLHYLSSLIHNDSKKKLLNLSQFLFKIPLNQELASKQEEMIRNNVDELNEVLAQNNNMEWLYLFLSKYSDLLSFEAKANYVEIYLKKEDNSQAWNFFKECFKQLRENANWPPRLEKYISTAEILFNKLVFNKATRKFFRNISEQNKSTILQCFDRNDILTDFLYSIFFSKVSFIPFESKCKNIAYVMKYFKQSDQQNLMSECLEQFQKEINSEPQYYISTAYLSLLAAQQYSEKEIRAITEKNTITVINMLLSAAEASQARNFYSLFLGIEEVMSLEVRVKLCGRELLHLSLNDQMELLSEILENFDATKNIFDYLAALEVLLSTLLKSDYDLENAEIRIIKLAIKHIGRVNQELLKDEGFSIFSRGALFSVLKKCPLVFYLNVKMKYIDTFRGKKNERFLWGVLGEYLKNIENYESLQFEKTICSFLQEIKRDRKFEADFVEKYQSIVNLRGQGLVSRNSPLGSFLLSVPNLLNFETKYLFLGPLSLGEKCDWLDECLANYRLSKSKPMLLKMIDDLCNLLNERTHQVIGEKQLKIIAEKYIDLITTVILPHSEKCNLGNFQALFLPIYPKILSLQERLAIIHRMSPQENRELLPLIVDRSHVLASSFHMTSGLTSDDWKTKKFKITFENENGVDAGGLLREWFTITTREILNPNFGLFIPTPGDSNTYMINKSSGIAPDHLQYFKFIGRFLAKGILENNHLDCPITKVLYKSVVDIPVEYKDFESQDPEFFNSLCFILKNPISEAGLDLTFSVEIEHYGAFREHDLIKNGKNVPVNDENKEEYVQLISAMKMTESIRPQLTEFLAGFYDIIPKHSITMFDENELEMILCGQSEIDVEDLEQNTRYSGYQESDDVIQWFWRALRSFDNIDRTRFLMFATGSSKAPLNGFAHLQGFNDIQNFHICKDLVVGDRLPTARTCFNRLDLPQYTSYEILREKLLLAIREGTEGFGMA